MKHIRFVPTEPRIVKGVKSEEGVEVFTTPARDFELSTVTLSKGQSLSFTSRSIQVYLLLEGDVLVTESGEHPLARKKGEAWVSFDRARFEVKAGSRAIIYRAAIPL